MIKSFYISNFKSIDRIDLRLTNFTCLVGLNGSGKSTILQAFDFSAQVMQGTIQEWLDSRGWNIKDLTNKNLKNRKTIELGIEIEFDELYDVTWNAKLDLRTLKCSEEVIFINTTSGDEPPVSILHDGKLININDSSLAKVIWEYEGSLFSSVSKLPEYAQKFKDYVSKISSLELLSPSVLRKRSRPKVKRIGIGGEKLAGFLYDLSLENKNKISKIMRDFYPSLKDFEIKSAVGGWKHLSFNESFSNQSIKTLADHTNDGMLRVLTIITQIISGDTSLILLDEIENGINQEIMGKLVDFLINSNIQIVATTHSPLFLNYLSDPIAMESVYFVYRDNDGNLGIKRFFSSIDEPEMLDYAGPGEIFANTDLKKLTDKILETESKNR